MDDGLRALPHDLRRTYALARGGWPAKVLLCVRSPGVQAVAVYRFGRSLLGLRWWLRLPLDLLYFVANGLLKMVWGIDLPRHTRAGAGLYIGHFGGITVSPSVVMGRNCSLSQDVTIGVSGFGDRRGTPVIGDNVYIAPGARVFGPVRVGDNVKIGANAVVHADVPDNAVVVLDPGFRIVSFSGNQGA